jgi:predicted dehydrogenase/threonine dehydrogenase-like Zn-dependent dehydrogenase
MGGKLGAFASIRERREADRVLQVIQPINGEATEVAEIPAPVCGPGQVLISNRASVISAGTERSTIELARQSLVEKARQRPDHVRRVLEKLKQEGFANTLRQVRARLDQPMPLGYSSAGVVIDVGEGVREFKIGDRVVSNGSHAGVVTVGKNLVARIPDEVPFEHAAYGVIASIALQGVRLAGVGIGDVVVVVGLGLIGQITVALLKSAGCRVIGTDIDPNKYELAQRMGAEFVGGSKHVHEILSQISPSGGADAVLITASTASNAPLELAAELSRDKGKVVAVGAVGLEVPRREFYHKELELIVSRSYGPGRYDSNYEESGHDYPISYVRWTEQRNIQAVLDQMAAGRLPVEYLTTHRYSINDAADAYSMIEGEGEAYLGIVLTYPESDLSRRVEMPRSRILPSRGNGISFVGTGNFASSTLVPAFLRAKQFEPRGLISARGLSARNLAKRYQFSFAGTSVEEVVADSQTSAVVLATRHHLHVPQGLDVLRSGKHLFMEKPLAISADQLDEWIEGVQSLGESCPVWMIGFNRRFSPAARILQEAFAKSTDPKALTIRFNAGAIPADHWVHDPEIGGGRIVGEACHAIDLATFLVGSLPVRVYSESIAGNHAGLGLEDNASIQVRFADGSVATILYSSTGDRSAGKERVEIFGGGMTGILDDFRKVEIRRQGRVIARRRWWSQQKGYSEEISAFRFGIETGTLPIPAEEMLAVTAASLRAVQSLRMETPLEVETPWGA